MSTAAAMSFGMLGNIGLELPDYDGEWNHVEVYGDVGTSNELVYQPAHPMEACSLLEWSRQLVLANLFTGKFRWMMHDRRQFVVHEGLVVNIAELNNDLERDEMHDTVLDCVLECKHVNCLLYTSPSPRDS